MFGVIVFLVILVAVLRRYCGPTSETVVYTRSTNWGRSSDVTGHHNSILNTHQMATMDGATTHHHLAVAQDMNNQVAVMTTSNGTTTSTNTTTM